MFRDDELLLKHWFWLTFIDRWKKKKEEKKEVDHPSNAVAFYSPYTLGGGGDSSVKKKRLGVWRCGVVYGAKPQKLFTFNCEKMSS